MTHGEKLLAFGIWHVTLKLTRLTKDYYCGELSKNVEDKISWNSRPPAEQVSVLTTTEPRQTNNVIYEFVAKYCIFATIPNHT
jgi:hypothetical protein